MIANEIADRYSLALYELAREQGRLEEVRQELDEIVSLVLETELKDVLFHPQIEESSKRKIINSAFAGEIDQYLLNFIYLLVDKQRIFFLPEIANRFNERFKREQEIVDVEAASASELTTEQKDSLEKKLHQLLNKQVNINYQILPDLIGGLRLQIGDRVIDGSIQYHLKQIQERIRQLPVSMLGVNDHEVES
ncbi:MAG: ATP synthase F1 subunit delta [Halanaerobium sp.]|nr:ATP synthase F1 subunit delta [Halanaerobium sp.]